MIDSQRYNNMARSLAGGKGMSKELFWFYQAVFYPFFLSAVYRVSNSSVICAKVIQALLGSVTCLLTYRLGKKIFNPAAGLIAALITVFYGPLIFFETELLASGWAAFWSLVLVLFFLETSSKKNLWTCLLLGICGALAVVTRPTFLPFFAAGVVWLAIVFYRSVHNRQQITKRVGVILVGFLLIAIPVAALNFRVTGHFGILPASGGINFYIGNNPDYDETICALPGTGWEEMTALPVKNGVHGDMWEEQKFYNRKVVDYIFKQPGSFVKGLAYKSVHFLNAREPPRSVDVYLFTKWSKLLGLLVWKVGRFGFPFGVLLPLAVLGVFSCWRKLPGPLLLFVILYPLSIILVFVSARYRVVMIPTIAIIASAELLKLIEATRACHWRRILSFSVLATLVVLLSTLPGPFPQEKVDYEAAFYRNVAANELKRGKIQQALVHTDKALQLMPEFGSAHATMGDVLTEMGRTDEAIEYFNRAVQLKPNLAHPHLSLGVAMAKQNNLDQAINHFSQVLRIDPRSRKALLYLGMIYSGQGEFEQAVECFTKLVKLEPNSALAQSNLGYALFQQGKLDEAIEYFNRALQLKPDFAQARQNLQRALQLKQELDQRTSQP
jgi:tetratricopeptide (TPR) repeat protein